VGIRELVGDRLGQGRAFLHVRRRLRETAGNDGDATQFVPISQPAPSPTPGPVSPTPIEPIPTPFPVDAIAPWLNSRLYTVKGVRRAEGHQGVAGRRR
jgi:hypothetical protein